MSRKRKNGRWGPLVGAELDRHIRAKMVIGALVNLGDDQNLAFYEDGTCTDAFIKGRVLLLDFKEDFTKVLHLDTNKVYLLHANRLRLSMQRRVQENWMNRYVKGKGYGYRRVSF